MATPATSAQKAADCQQKLPGSVIDFRRERAKCGGVVVVDLVWQSEHVMIRLPLFALKAKAQKSKVSRCYTETKAEGIEKVIPSLT